ncbi:MAG: DUF3048 domain-containing protein, partial [Chloroflexi bacterium]|nr:DUF3048 domain-containing protein [Chloroflexota bacterium]
MSLSLVLVWSGVLLIALADDLAAIVAPPLVSAYVAVNDFASLPNETSRPTFEQGPVTTPPDSLEAKDQLSEPAAAVAPEDTTPPQDVHLPEPVAPSAGSLLKHLAELDATLQTALATAAPSSAGRVFAQLGSPGGYVPYGALSISSPHTVQGKRYPAGTFEYLHGLFKIPLPLPNVPVESAQRTGESSTCPLTGLPLTNPNLLNRRPLNIRVDNAPLARPQSGLSSADIIFETLTEGGVTRFTAVFLCTPHDVQVGPIRSARLIDLQLAPMFKAILVHVGASAPVTDMIWSSEIGSAEMDPDQRDSPGFGRVAWRRVPHNMYARTDALWAAAAEQHVDGPVDLTGFAFDSKAPDGGQAVRAIHVPAGAAADVSYAFADGLYTKRISGAAHLDMTTGQPLRFANVIVLYAKLTVTPIIEDVQGERSLFFDVQGEGRALLFRDGQSYEAVWHRDARNLLFRFTDENGNVLALKPGTTIVNIVSPDIPVT